MVLEVIKKEAEDVPQHPLGIVFVTMKTETMANWWVSFSFLFLHEESIKKKSILFDNSNISPQKNIDIFATVTNVFVLQYLFVFFNPTICYHFLCTAFWKTLTQLSMAASFLGWSLNPHLIVKSWRWTNGEWRSHLILKIWTGKI